MKQYYNNRVKADFAPKVSESEEEEEAESPAREKEDQSPDVTKDSAKKKKEKGKKAKPVNDRNGWNEMFWTSKKNKKARYIKQSDRTIKINNENPFKKRGVSVDGRIKINVDPTNPAVARYDTLPHIDLKLSDRLWNAYTSKVITQKSGATSPNMLQSKLTLNSNERILE